MELRAITNPCLHQPHTCPHQEEQAAILKAETDTGQYIIDQSPTGHGPASPHRPSRLNAVSVTSPFNPDVQTPRQTEQADLDICSFIDQINQEIETRTSLTHGGGNGEDQLTPPPKVSIGSDEIKHTQADGADQLATVHSPASTSCVECSLVLRAIDWLDANALHVIGLWSSAARYHSPARSQPRQENFARLAWRNVELIQVQIQKMAGGGLVPDQTAARSRELKIAAVNNGRVLEPAALDLIEKYFMSQL